MVLSPENKDDVYDKETDDQNLMETRGIEEAAREVEVFYPSLENNQQQANPITAEKQKRRKAKKIRWKKKLKKALPEDINQPLEEAHLEILHLAPYDLFKLYFDKDMQS